MSSDDLVAARIEALRQRDPQSEPDDYWTGWNDALDKVLALAAKPEPGLDVERLAEAFHAFTCSKRGHAAEYDRPYVEAVAAEYARLSDEGAEG